MLNLPKVLVVAAWEPELTRLRELLASNDAGNQLAFTLESVGVGLVEAAVGMTRWVGHHRPDVALFIGTCGTLPLGAGRPGSRAAPGDVVVASRVELVDDAVACGASQLPGPMPAGASFDREVHDTFVASGARSVQVANTVGITVDDALAARIAHAGYEVEHLEALSFARACASAAVRCAVVLGVANSVGSNGRAEWLANHAQASASAADVAWRARGALARLLRRTTTPPSPEPT